MYLNSTFVFYFVHLILLKINRFWVKASATRPQYKSKRKTEQPLTTHKPVETAPVIKGYTNKAEYNEINWTGP